MPISMEPLAQELNELKSEIAADQILLRIAMGHLKAAKFIDEEFVDAIIEDAKKDLAGRTDGAFIVAKLIERRRAIFPQK